MFVSLGVDALGEVENPSFYDKMQCNVPKHKVDPHATG